MKTTDFFYLGRRLINPIVLGFLSCYALPAMAEPPTPQDFARSDELVLTLSDKWLEPNTPNNRANGSQSLTEPPKSKDAPIGCGMDVTPLASSDGSFSNRVVGKCNLTLRY